MPAPAPAEAARQTNTVLNNTAERRKSEDINEAPITLPGTFVIGVANRWCNRDCNVRGRLSNIHASLFEIAADET